ncbi:MAG: CatB-related O-acetyltransferase [Ruminiclostridium sp.]|nr:CatB-related O-acetyltransferase [Ruminiclostridium sp.]
MNDRILPDPMTIFPIPGSDAVTLVKPTITNPNIIVGDFTYYSGSDFQSRVTHHYDFIGDRLIIGKFCQIAAGAEFVMNGANHRMNTVTTFPFNIFPSWEQKAPPMSELPLKGDTVIGNDVWIGQNSVILPGVHIGDGAIIGADSVVGSDVPPYTIAVGNPAKPVRKRFGDDLIALLEELRWWDMSIAEIKDMMPLLSCSDLDRVKTGIIKIIDERKKQDEKIS